MLFLIFLAFFLFALSEHYGSFGRRKLKENDLHTVSILVNILFIYTFCEKRSLTGYRQAASFTLGAKVSHLSK